MAAAALAAGSSQAAHKKPANKICAFEKFLQDLSYDQLAETIAELGFDGIEATVRKNGHVLPERVEDDLPKMVAALEKHGLEITVMASDVNRVDAPLSERVLRTAASLGVKRYRMGNYRYDLKQPVQRQLDELRPIVKDLVAMNREHGVQAVYQNHSGARYVGASIWDIYSLVREYPVKDIGIAFDIRHATVEGGLSWPTYFNLVRPHLGAVFFKDFLWKGRRPENVSLGEGKVDPAFGQMLVGADFVGPISLHIEYLRTEGVAANVAALRKDLATLRQWLAAS